MGAGKFYFREMGGNPFHVIIRIFVWVSPRLKESEYSAQILKNFVKLRDFYILSVTTAA